MSIPITEQLEALVDLDSSEFRLTDWEVDFIDSCEKRVRAGNTLTPNQEAKISAVYDEVFLHGRRDAR